MRDSVKTALWFGFSLLLIAGLVYFADLDRVLDAVSKAEVIWLVPALVAGLSVIGVWTFTWWNFFKKMDLDISYRKSLRMFLGGTFLNSITPLGQFGGEPLMAYIISNNTDASYEKSFSAVLSADIVNAIPVFTVVLGASTYLLLFSSQMNQIIFQTLGITLIVTVLGGTAVYLLWFKSGYIENKLLGAGVFLAEKIGRGHGIISRMEKSLQKVEKSFETVGKDPANILKVATFVHLGVVLQIITLYFVLYSLGIQTEILPLFFVIAISGLANFTPTPGGSGTYEAAMAGLLNFFSGIEFASAISVAIIYRFLTYWPGLLLGWIALTTLERPDK